jgi:hypothetical protein
MLSARIGCGRSIARCLESKFRTLIGDFERDDSDWLRRFVPGLKLASQLVRDYRFTGPQEQAAAIIEASVRELADQK